MTIPVGQWRTIQRGRDRKPVWGARWVGPASEAPRPGSIIEMVSNSTGQRTRWIVDKIARYDNDGAPVLALRGRASSEEEV